MFLRLSTSHPLFGLAYLGVALCAAPRAHGQGARAHVVADFYSDMVFSQQAAGQKMPVGNLCKVATACVALDWARATRADLNQPMQVPSSASVLGVQPLGLQPGDRLSIRDALSVLLMASDNVAAETLANHVGLDIQKRRSQGGHPIGVFVREMNNLCARQGMTKTQFANPHGMDLRARSFSTAADLAKLSKYALQQPGFTFYTQQRERRIKIMGQGGDRSISVRNLNTLLGQNRIDGVTTGQTPSSGPCAIISATRPDIVSKLPDNRSQIYKRRLIVVVLGAADRMGAAAGYLDYGWQQYEGWNAAGRPKGNKGSSLSTY